MPATAVELYALLDGLPAGAWVAISSEELRVLSFGDDLPTVMDQALEMGNAHPFVARVPESDNLLFL